MSTATQQDHTYQFFQPLSRQEREALKRDIEARGIQVPIELDNAGVILDGHHRWEIAQELGLPEEKIPTHVRDELTTEADKGYLLNAGQLSVGLVR
jgi:ParB-like chromosome segregation protein Spo0J